MLGLRSSPGRTTVAQHADWAEMPARVTGRGAARMPTTAAAAQRQLDQRGDEEDDSERCGLAHSM